MPRVARLDYQLLNVDGDRVSLLTDSGVTKDDLDLPKDSEGSYDDVAKSIQAAFDDGKTVVVSVIAAVGQEKIVSMKVEGA